MVDVNLNNATLLELRAAISTVDSSEGGNVNLAGTTLWGASDTVEVPGGVNIFGNQSTFLRHSTPMTGQFPPMFYLRSGSGKSRLSGFELDGRFAGTGLNPPDDVVGDGIAVGDMVDFRVDHCRLLNFPRSAVMPSSAGQGSPCRGVVDHNYIAALYKETIGGLWNYGVLIGSNNYWEWDDDITHFLGKYETIPAIFPTVYVEDNEFYLTRHAIASAQLAWYTFRHNTVTQTWNSAVDVHGGGDIGAGGRGAEVYDNTINSPLGIVFRGGGGYIYNNTLNCSAGCIGLQRDSETQLRGIHDLWIGTNAMNEAGFYNTGGWIENVDYYQRAPTLALDGFTYTPYTYPHPLVSTAPQDVTPKSVILNAGRYAAYISPLITAGGKTYQFSLWEET